MLFVVLNRFSFLPVFKCSIEAEAAPVRSDQSGYARAILANAVTTLANAVTTLANAVTTLANAATT